MMCKDTKNEKKIAEKSAKSERKIESEKIAMEGKKV
jgi:hypothetical protein